MKDSHVLEELSAFIDGEADRPEGIARHLQHCEECARRHMELLRLSAHLKALPGPDPQDDFVVRVLHQIDREQGRVLSFPGEKTPGSRMLWVLPGLAAAAAILIVASLALLRIQPVPQESVPTVAAAPPASLPAVPPALDETQVARLLAEEPVEGMLELSLSPVENPDPVGAVPLDDLLEEIALASASEEPVDMGAPEGDLFGIIDDLNPAELTQFQRLVESYANQG